MKIKPIVLGVFLSIIPVILWPVMADDKAKIYKPKVGDRLEFSIAEISSASKFGKPDIFFKQILIVTKVTKNRVDSNLIWDDGKIKTKPVSHKWKDNPTFFDDEFLGLSITKPAYEVKGFKFNATKLSAGTNHAWFASDGKKGSRFPGLLRFDSKGHVRLALVKITRKN